MSDLQDIVAASQLRDDRTAAESIRGYVYQAALTAVRWVELGERAVIVCEGNEDIDVLLLDENSAFVSIEETQAKAIDGRVTARSPAVHETIFNFCRAFHEHSVAGQACTFVFSTTAELAKQSAGRSKTASALDDVDVLKTWQARAVGDTSRDRELCRALEALANTYLSEPAGDGRTTSKTKHVEAVRAALGYLNGDDLRWSAFLDAVRWDFGQPDLVGTRARLQTLLSTDPRTKTLPAALMASRVIMAVLTASSSKETVSRVLTRDDLLSLSKVTQDDLTLWAARTNALAFFHSVEGLTQRVAAIEAAMRPDVIRARKVSRVQSIVAARSADRQHLDRSWTKYFRSRVVSGLFLPPYDFELRLRELSLGTDVAGAALSGLTETLGRVPAVPASVPPNVQRPLQELLGASAPPARNASGLPVALDQADWAGTQRRRVNALDEASRTALQDRTLSDEKRSAVIALREWLQDYSDALAVLRRVFAPIWIAIAQAGRGKSTFAWHIADRLAKQGRVVALLTGRDISAARPDLSVLLADAFGLSPGDDADAVRDALQARTDHEGQPVVVIIDAINESLNPSSEVGALLTGLLAQGMEWRSIRFLITCRDVYWRYHYEALLAPMADFSEPLSQLAVLPPLDDAGIDAYFQHYNISNLRHGDLKGPHWTSNPLLLRIYCETQQGSVYDGPKPVEFRSFRILSEYFKQKGAELAARDFGVLDLIEELDRLTSRLIAQGTSISDETGTVGLTLASTRDALSLRSAKGEPLFDALLDMDVILRLDPVSPVDTHVCFSLERVQDYFFGRWILASQTSWTDASLARMREYPPLRESAIGTAIAYAIDQQRLTNIAPLLRSVATTLDTLFDLLEPAQLRPFQTDIIKALQLDRAMEDFSEGLVPELNVETQGRRSFSESYALEVLAAAVSELPSVDRHRRFYAQRTFVDAFADLLLSEILAMRSWALDGFLSFPEGIEVAVARRRAVALLLAANSPQVRDAAHEWLFWVARFDPDASAALFEELAHGKDLLVAERAAALRYGLLRRVPELATRETLRDVFIAGLKTEFPHYLAVEFARKTLMEHAHTAREALTVEEWEVVTAPPRVVAADENTGPTAQLEPRPSQSTAAARTHADEVDGDTDEVDGDTDDVDGDADDVDDDVEDEGVPPPVVGGRTRRETQWAIREPIHADMSRYTLGHRFREFRADDMDQAVRDTLAVLPRLGYAPDAYADLDLELARQENPRSWHEGGRRYERFGKTWAHAASFVILQQWAERVPARGRLEQLRKPFFFDQPEYDFMFQLQRPRCPSFDHPFTFPTELTRESWPSLDERAYVDRFLRNFPDETAVHLSLTAKSRGAEFFVLRDAIVADPELLAAWVWAIGDAPGTDGREPDSYTDYYDDGFSFHQLSGDGLAIPDMEYELVKVCVDYVRTMNDADRSVLTVSPRLAKAASLKDSEVAGEFVNHKGETIVRTVVWDDENGHGSACLMRTAEFRAACTSTDVAFAFDDYAELSERTPRSRETRNLLRRWRLTLADPVGPVPPEVISAVEEWIRLYGPLRSSQKVECCTFFRAFGAVGLAYVLCKAEFPVRGSSPEREQRYERLLNEVQAVRRARRGVAEQ